MSFFDKHDIKQLNELIDKANLVVIVAHTSPDGDAVGSTLALAHAMEAMGKAAKVIVPSTPSHQLRFLPGFRNIEVYKENPDFARALITRADLIFCLDFNALSRIDDMAEPIAAAAAPKVMIDHHLEPEMFCKITISHPEISSTCMLLFKVLCALELVDTIEKPCAECILAGMMTDTGNFSYNSNDPEIYRIVAELVARGANHDRLAKMLFDTFSENCLRLNAYAMYEKLRVWEDKGAALITLTRAELKEFHSKVGDTEGLVNKPLAIERVQWSCFLREEEGYVKVSMRSKGNLPVDEICKQHFNGGGHRNAAGGEFRGSMEQAISTFESIIDWVHEKYVAK